ncbi:MAG: sigma-54 interaction domain-containing protein [Thermodesulfobacteriota bacterium]
MELENHWKTILDTLQDGMMVVDPEGKIVAVNPATETLTGYKSSELVGNTCRMLNCTGCNIRKERTEKWCGLFSKGEVKSKRCTILSKSGRAIYVLKSATVIRDKTGETVGAVEILTDISDTVRQEEKLAALRQTLNLENGYHDLIGGSAVMQELFELIENVAQSDAPVMILGESGTGKELTALAIHEASPRRDGSFIKVNCAALNENLLESELFGHVKGAFTGAERTRIGRFEAAHGGSLFLDEVGDIPLSIQVKLLRVIEGGVIERVGDHQPIPVDVRIISATNRNLETMIAAGRFREDLFFRINVFPLQCPSLSQRREDIPVLVQNFIKYGTRKSGKRIIGLTPEAMEVLTEYPWPGNVRELRNAIDYALVLCRGGLIDTAHLPPKISRHLQAAPPRPLSEAPHESERRKLIQLLTETGGNRNEAARKLGISRVTLWKRMKRYRLEWPRTV